MNSSYFFHLIVATQIIFYLCIAEAIPNPNYSNDEYEDSMDEHESQPAPAPQEDSYPIETDADAIKSSYLANKFGHHGSTSADGEAVEEQQQNGEEIKQNYLNRKLQQGYGSNEPEEPQQDSETIKQNYLRQKQLMNWND